METSKFTVIIPTRERRDVLEKSILTVMAQDYENLEIIVCDNFSQDGTGDFVRSLNDKRIKYVNPGKRLSMSHNWEFALSHIGNDGWVTIIGDDDGLLPGACQNVVALAAETKAQVIRTVTCHYSWPSIRRKKYGSLFVSLMHGHEVRNSAEWLSHLMHGKLNSYQHLPFIYTGGFVSAAAVNAIRTKTGVFFNSVTPDIYSATALASAVDRFVFSRDCISIAGASRHSTGGSQFAKPGAEIRGKDGKSAMQSFAAEENIPFHPSVPMNADGTYPRSMYALIYECFLQSAHLRSDNMGVTAGQQLELILAETMHGSHSVQMLEWSKTFAAMHQLDFDVILEQAKSRAASRKFRKPFFAPHTERFFWGTKSMPLLDVYEASKVANSLSDKKVGVRDLIERFLPYYDYLAQNPSV